MRKIVGRTQLIMTTGAKHDLDYMKNKKLAIIDDLPNAQMVIFYSSLKYCILPYRRYQLCVRGISHLTP